jgi:hypothetical protein
MRHTFVSVLSANGVPVESIALLAGHERSATTEAVYRHEIRPALTPGRGSNGQNLQLAASQPRCFYGPDVHRMLRHVGAAPANSDNQAGLAEQYCGALDGVVLSTFR